jgi:hypothetical protein
MPFEHSLKFPVIELFDSGFYKAEFYLLYFQRDCVIVDDYIDFMLSFGGYNFLTQRYHMSDFIADNNEQCKNWNKVELTFEVTNQTDLYVGFILQLFVCVCLFI